MSSSLDFTGIQSLMSDDETLVVKNLRDFHDLQLFAQIYIGSEKQPFDMIFDTGSNYLWVMSSSCRNCPVMNQKFFESESTSFKNTFSPISLYYGSGSVNGQHAIDNICLKPAGLCATDFSFVLVSDQRSLS